jgi:putative transposase
MGEKTEQDFSRRNTRIPGYDYSQPGGYFVTIYTQGRQCIFGNIENEAMIPNQLGKIVIESWLWLQKQYPYIILDEFNILPNHFHGTLIITDVSRRGGSRTALQEIQEPHLADGNIEGFDRGGSRTAPTGVEHVKPLGGVIGAFKTVSTKQINLNRQTPGQVVWQRNYYEHIIRDELELARIRNYILDNPLQWSTDQENPDILMK